MKALLIGVISAGALLAQAPPPPKAAAKSTPKTAAPAPKTGASPSKAPAPASKTGAPASKAGAPAARPNPLLNPAALRAVAPPVYRVKFTTTKGDFVVEVNRDWAPIGADRFYNLVRNRFFNDAAFFRIVPNFIVQFGMSANPAVSKAWENANIKDEPVKHGNKKGTITFAQTQMPNTRSTQFFINLKDNDFLDAQNFSAFGTVTEGLEVVTSLYSGYGEQPDQGRISAEGKAYLDRSFPKLDVIKSTAIIFPAPATPAPATKKAAPATKSAAPAGTPAPAPKKATTPAPAPTKK